MLSDTPGLHHVTGIVGDPAAAAGFYAEPLGLRLLRRTVNYEDVLQYHLYFGDATGAPGSVFTVFPDPHADPGRTGKPGYEAVAFAVPPGSLDHWRERFADRGVAVEVDGEPWVGDAEGAGPLAGTPVALDSSAGDPYVAAERVRATADVFERGGAAVDLRIDDGNGHGLSDATMGRIGDRLKALLGSSGAASTPE